MTAAVVGHLNHGPVHGHTHLLQQIGKALRTEDGLLFVAGFIQTDHHAITEQLVVTHAFNRNQVLKPRRGRKRSRQGRTDNDLQEVFA